MNTISISRIKGQLTKVISCLEDHIDKKAVKDSDFKKGRDFEKIVKKLGICGGSY